jgi:FxLD family lantipeptide
MIYSATSAQLTATQGPSPADAETDGFQLDVRIVETGPAAAALLGSTDDGCDTVRGGDC